MSAGEQTALPGDNHWLRHTQRLFFLTSEFEQITLKKIQLTLEYRRAWGADPPCTTENPWMTLDSPKT